MITDVNRVNKETIKRYQDIRLDDVIREFLLYKGTWSERMSGEREPANKVVHPKNPDLINTCLWLYDLKSNQTNKRNCSFYIEKQARKRMIIRDNHIVIPTEIWDSCDCEFNKQRRENEKGI